MKFKFEVGDKVELSDGRKGEILTVIYDSDNGTRYRVSMNSVDFKTNEIIEGAITANEDEIEKVKEEKMEEENV